MTLHHGDCLDVMAGMDPESVDAIVTDPPYGLGFMGKAWDAAAGPGNSPMRRRAEHDAVMTGVAKQGGRQRQGTDYQRRQARDGREYQAWTAEWAALALAAARSSSYLLSFGGSRTHHRLMSGIEDAGWEVRDCLVWAYASGFPKSKASLKPAWEPIIMARKPGPLRMLAIDECRIETTQDERDWIERTARPNTRGDRHEGAVMNRPTAPTVNVSPLGRWPANVILTDPIFDGGVEGVVGGGHAASGGNINGRPVTGYGGHWADSREFDGYGDSGTYSRFFLIPKADRSDREPVLGGLSQSVSPRIESAHSTVCAKCGRQRVNVNDSACKCPDPEWVRKPQTARANVHPTVKPTDLMRHLVRLVTPPGGIVLDPFLGSGTTAIAAEMEGFEWIGIEREAEYVAIAEARLNGVQKGLGLSA